MSRTLVKALIQKSGQNASYKHFETDQFAAIQSLIAEQPFTIVSFENVDIEDATLSDPAAASSGGQIQVLEVLNETAAVNGSEFQIPLMPDFDNAEGYNDISIQVKDNETGKIQCQRIVMSSEYLSDKPAIEFNYISVRVWKARSDAFVKATIESVEDTTSTVIINLIKY